MDSDAVSPASSVVSADNVPIGPKCDDGRRQVRAKAIKGNASLKDRLKQGHNAYNAGFLTDEESKRKKETTCSLALSAG